MVDIYTTVVLILVVVILAMSKLTIISQNGFWCPLFGHPEKWVDINKYNDKQLGFCTRCEKTVIRIEDFWTELK